MYGNAEPNAGCAHYRRRSSANNNQPSLTGGTGIYSGQSATRPSNRTVADTCRPLFWSENVLSQTTTTTTILDRQKTKRGQVSLGILLVRLLFYAGQPAQEPSHHPVRYEHTAAHFPPRKCSKQHHHRHNHHEQAAVRGQSIYRCGRNRQSVGTDHVRLFVRLLRHRYYRAVGCGGLDLAFFLCIDLAHGTRRRGEATDNNSIAESDVE
jgi:hypothetical protein